jgi:hypothetical protein
MLAIFVIEVIFPVFPFSRWLSFNRSRCFFLTVGSPERFPGKARAGESEQPSSSFDVFSFLSD